MRNRLCEVKFRILIFPPQLIALVGWCLAFVVAMGLIYGPHDAAVLGNRDWNTAEKVFFASFERFLWGLVLAWVIYACHYGYGSTFKCTM